MASASPTLISQMFRGKITAPPGQGLAVLVPYAVGPYLAQPSSCSPGDQLSPIAPAGKRISKLVGFSADTSPKQQDTLTYSQRYKLLRALSTLWNGLPAWQE